MSLLPHELDICKQQLGYPLTRLGAEPWVAYVVIFDRVIQPFLFDNSTTSSTTVAANAGNTTITVAANPAAANDATKLTFNVGTSVVVDVGLSLETSTIAAISGLSFTLNLVNAHTAPYPIWPNGAEWVVRGILTRIATIEANMTSIAPTTAGAKKVDEIEMYSSSKNGGRGATRDTFESLLQQRAQARHDLAGALGVTNLWKLRSGGSRPSRVEAY
jgi:hypothetical protein